MELSGRSIIGFGAGSAGARVLYGVNPATGERLQPGYASANLEEVDRAARLAGEAFSVYGRLTGVRKAALLREIARNIEGLGEGLTARATAETGLPAGRVQGETARTCGQLRLFAGLIEEGSWVDARIDHADPERKPVPKPTSARFCGP